MSLAESISRVARPDTDVAKLAGDDEEFGRWAVVKSRKDGSIVGAGDFIVDRIGAIVRDAIQSIAKNVRFGMAMVLHESRGMRESAGKLTNFMCWPG